MTPILQLLLLLTAVFNVKLDLWSVGAVTSWRSGAEGDCPRPLQGLCADSNLCLHTYPHVCHSAPFQFMIDSGAPSVNTTQHLCFGFGEKFECPPSSTLRSICISNATFQCSSNASSSSSGPGSGGGGSCDVVLHCVHEAVLTVSPTIHYESCEWREGSAPLARCQDDEVMHGVCISDLGTPLCNAMPAGSVLLQCCLSEKTACSPAPYWSKTGDTECATGTAVAGACSHKCDSLGSLTPTNVAANVSHLFFCQGTIHTRQDVFPYSSSCQTTQHAIYMCPEQDQVITSLKNCGTDGGFQVTCRKLRFGSIDEFDCVDVSSNQTEDAHVWCPGDYAMRGVCAIDRPHSCGGTDINATVRARCCKVRSYFQGGTPCLVNHVYTSLGNTRARTVPIGIDRDTASSTALNTFATTSAALGRSCSYCNWLRSAALTDDRKRLFVLVGSYDDRDPANIKGSSFILNIPIVGGIDPVVHLIAGSTSEFGYTGSAANAAGQWPSNDGFLMNFQRGATVTTMSDPMSGQPQLLVTEDVMARSFNLFSSTPPVFAQRVAGVHLQRTALVNGTTPLSGQDTFPNVITDSKFRFSAGEMFFCTSYSIVVLSSNTIRHYLGKGIDPVAPLYANGTFRTEVNAMSPSVMFIEADALMYFTDYQTSSVLQVDLQSGIMTTLPLNPIIVGTFGITVYHPPNRNLPTRMFLTAQGHAIWEVNMATLTTNKFSGDVSNSAFVDRTTLSLARYESPKQLISSENQLFILDTANGAIRVILLDPCSKEFNSTTQCQTCNVGYFHPPHCRSECTLADDCNGRATSVSGSQPSLCMCECKEHFAGNQCESCVRGYDIKYACTTCTPGYTDRYPTCRSKTETISSTRTLTIRPPPTPTRTKTATMKSSSHSRSEHRVSLTHRRSKTTTLSALAPLQMKTVTIMVAPLKTRTQTRGARRPRTTTQTKPLTDRPSRATRTITLVLVPSSTTAVPPPTTTIIPSSSVVPTTLRPSTPDPSSSLPTATLAPLSSSFKTNAPSTAAAVSVAPATTQIINTTTLAPPTLSPGTNTTVAPTIAIATTHSPIGAVPVVTLVSGALTVDALTTGEPTHDRTLVFQISNAYFDPDKCQLPNRLQFEAPPRLDGSFLQQHSVWCNYTHLTVVFSRTSDVAIGDDTNFVAVFEGTSILLDSNTTVRTSFSVKGPEIDSAVEAATTAAAATTVAVSVAGGGGTAATQIQGLAVVGMVSCASSGMKGATRATRKTMTPFQLGGDPEVGFLLGNVIIVAGFVAVVCLGLGVFFIKFHHDDKVGKVPDPDPFPDPTNDEKLERLPLERAKTLLSFPGCVHAVVCITHQGIALESHMLLHDPTVSVTGKIIGALGAIYSIACPILVLVKVMRFFRGQYCAYRYINRELPLLVRFFLPSHFWLSLRYTNRYGIIFKHYRQWPDLLFAVYDPLIKVNIVAAVAAFQLSRGTPCTAQYGILAFIYGAEALVRMIKWPQMTPLGNVSPIFACITTSLLACSAGFEFQLVSTEIAIIVQTYLTMAITLILAIISLLDEKMWQKKEIKARHENGDWDFSAIGAAAPGEKSLEQPLTVVVDVDGAKQQQSQQEEQDAKSSGRKMPILSVPNNSACASKANPLDDAADTTSSHHRERARRRTEAATAASAGAQSTLALLLEAKRNAKNGDHDAPRRGRRKEPAAEGFKQRRRPRGFRPDDSSEDPTDDDL